jgi:methylglutaconyl-CoA hydratase
MLDELAATLAAFSADAGVRLVVLRGSGRHFCTGADLAGRATAAPADEGTHASLRDVLTALDTLPKPTLALVHGAAVGGGAAFAACCDIAVATEEAFFSFPEVRVGMAPLGVAPFIVRAIGHRAFRRFGCSGERISATEARRLGLVHEVCSTDALEDTWTHIADELLHGAPGAISTLKRAIAQYATPTPIPETQTPHEPRSPEALEGIASFREKRKPNWYPQ